MTEADRIFERFPDFIREFIYSHSWDSLRAVQIAAAKTIFEIVSKGRDIPSTLSRKDTIMPHTPLINKNAAATLHKTRLENHG